MASMKLAYMPQENNSMLPQYLQEQNLRTSVGSKSGIWGSAPPATPQASNTSMSSVWGSPLSVLPTATPTSSVNPPGIPTAGGVAPAYRTHSGMGVGDIAPQSLAALAADSEPVASNDSSVGPSAFAPSLSSASSRLSSRQNSQTDISSPVVSAAALNPAPPTPGPASASGTLSGSPMSSGKGSGLSGDEIINTAIVVKNIPFAIKKEQLIDYMTQLELPLPYAFNYHFDNGVFRGLAFANFTTAEETAIVISSLNGRELGGRKLRVEYKKMLPFQERERIEREKRERRGQLEEQHQTSQNRGGNHSHAQTQNQLNSQQGAISQATAAAETPQPASQQSSFSTSRPASASGSPHAVPQSLTVDMNDAEVLQTYSSLLLFKRDLMKTEICIPAPHAALLARHQINSIKILCRRLDLNCHSSDEQGILISKRIDSMEPETDFYLSGLLKNAVPTASSAYALPRMSAPSLTPATNNLNAMNALNRWNSVSNLASLGGQNLGSGGSTLAPK